MHDTKVLIFLLNTCRYHKHLLQSLTVKHCHKYGDPVLRCTLYYFPFEAIPAIEKVSIHRERFKEHFSLFSVCGCFLTKTVHLEDNGTMYVLHEMQKATIST